MFDLATACRHLLSPHPDLVCGGPDPQEPVNGFRANAPRLLGCLRGHLHLHYGTPAGERRCRLPPGGLACIPAACWFRHRATRSCLMLNLARRQEGLDYRLRRCRAGTWQDEQTHCSPPTAIPRSIDQAFALVSTLAGQQPLPNTAFDHACRTTLALCADHIEACAPAAGDRGRHRDLRWLQLIECIQEQLDQELSRDRVAAQVGIHPNHLSRLCASRGLRFVDLVNRLRIDAACRLLVVDERPVHTIAAACGFTSAQYFNRVFSSINGCSPGAWRRGQRS